LSQESFQEYLVDSQLAVSPQNDFPAASSLENVASVSAAPVAPLPRSVNRAWIIRGLAYVVDVGVLYLFGLAIGVVSGLLFRAALPVLGLVQEYGGEVNWFTSFGIGFIVSTIYSTLFEWLFGATPGKLILRQRVVQDDGTPCRLWPALAREVARLLDGLFIGLVAYTEMKKSPLHQRLGDRWGRTLVVSSRDPFIRCQRPWYMFAVGMAVFLAFDFVISGGNLLLSGPIVPQDQAYAQRPASSLNLALAEVGSSFSLQTDSPLRSSEDIREGNERLFVAPGSAVKSRITVFKVYLTDQESGLAGLAQKWARQEVGMVREFRTLGRVKCADRASFQTFSTTTENQQGYVLEFVKRNVLVSVLSVSSTDKVHAEDVEAWGCAVAARVR
jgi:uncharacterized RDD family membrane protein YckC